MIKDEDNNEVDFDNIEWFLTLIFNMTYKNEYGKPSLLGDVKEGV